MMNNDTGVTVVNKIAGLFVAERAAHDKDKADALTAMKADYDSQLSVLSGAVAAANLSIDALTAKVADLQSKHDLASDQVPPDVEAAITSLFALASNPA